MHDEDDDYHSPGGGDNDDYHPPACLITNDIKVMIINLFIYPQFW